MPIITLLSDFGLEQEYVGVMKGVILNVNPRARIVDLTHQVPRHNLLEAGLALAASYEYFPQETVHVAVVDPGVGTARRVLAARHRGHLFLAPDNGLLTPILAGDGTESVFSVENTSYFLPRVSHTFHGRDIFAPVAAHLSLGAPLQDVGPLVPPQECVLLRTPAPRVEQGGKLLGQVLAWDRFGNLVTNIHKAALSGYLQLWGAQDLTIEVGPVRIKGISTGYASEEPGSLVAVMGSRGLLEIAVDRGSAKERLAACVGTPVTLSRTADPL